MELKEADRVIDWKYGNEEKRSTLNAVNMLGYTDISDNILLSKEIWNRTKSVEYGDTGSDYGNYTQGETKIRLNKNLLGGGKEASAKLATVISHEGTHTYGNRIEGVAHLYGAETYSQLGDIFGLKGDGEFANQMLDGIMNPENWKENTGDVDHWRMTWGGKLLSDGDGWLKNMNGEYVLDEDGNRIGAEIQESGLLNIMAGTSGQKYDSFSDEQKLLVQSLMEKAGLSMDKNGQWNTLSGKELNMSKVMELFGNTIASQVFNTYYNNKVDFDLATAWNLDLKFSDTAMNKIVLESVQDRYSELITNHLNDTTTPAALKDKYTWSIYDDKTGVATEFFKIDENNSWLDDLVKQTDFDSNSTIYKYGCNFISTIAFPQLLTGQILDKTEIQSIWDYGRKQEAYSWGDKEIMPWIVEQSEVKQPDLLANETFKRLGYDTKMLFGGNHAYDVAGMKIRVPYKPHHFVLGNVFGSILYNPANSIGNHTREDTVYVY